MALTPLKRIPPLKDNLPIVDGQGRPTFQFLRYMNLEFIQTVEQNQADLTNIINLILETQDIALAAQATANEALGNTLGPDTRSGSVTVPFNTASTSFTNFGQVDLTDVSAGDLVITGSAPKANPSSVIAPGGFGSAEYRIVEEPSGDTVFTGTFTVFDALAEPGMTAKCAVEHTSASSVNGAIIPRTTTGDLSYSIEIRRLSGDEATGLNFYLYTRRQA